MTTVTETAAAVRTGLRWPLKRSFLRYLGGLADSLVVFRDGARLLPDGSLEFPPTADPSAFAGGVRFLAHRGFLHLRLAAPVVRLDGAHGTLTVLTTTEEGDVRLPLATFTVGHHPGGWTGTSVRLTPEGVALFNGVYPAGEPLEDLECTELEGAAHAGMESNPRSTS